MMEGEQEGRSEQTQGRGKAARIRMRRELFYLKQDGDWYECEQHADSVTLWEIGPEGYRGSRSLSLESFQQLVERGDVEITTAHPYESSTSA